MRVSMVVNISLIEFLGCGFHLYCLSFPNAFAAIFDSPHLVMNVFLKSVHGGHVLVAVYLRNSASPQASASAPRRNKAYRTLSRSLVSCTPLAPKYSSNLRIQVSALRFLPSNSLGSGNLNLSLVVAAAILVCGTLGGGGVFKNEDVTGNPTGGACLKVCVLCWVASFRF